MPDDTAAVMPDFADAAGLEALAAAGGRAVSSARSHGDAAKAAPSPAVVWPPPETPGPFKTMVRQLDSVGSMLTAMLTGAPVTPEPEKFVDEVADGIWPLAFYYGAGSDKPTAGMLWAYAAVSVLGLVAVKVARVKAAKEQKGDADGEAGA